MKKIISMSLYGKDAAHYATGAIANAKLVPTVFPGWTMRVYYCCRNVDPAPLKALGCEVVPMSSSRIHAGMFWRFLSAWDTGIERVLFRDTDSRLNIREAAAVKAWEESGLVAHCMKDHPHHSRMPLSGGMWGIITNTLPKALHDEVRHLINRPQKRVADMKWLASKVQPLIAHSLLRHSSVSTPWESIPFPPHEKYDGFVGQQFDIDDNGIWPEVK